jgi:osmotically inducible protein OsmC
VPRIVREASVHWQGSVARGGGRAVAGTGAFELPVDLPARIAGIGADKTSPEELLAAAHAACFAMSLGGELARAGGTVEAVDVHCVVTMDEVEGKGHLVVASELDASVRAGGVDEGILAEAARAADEGCPFSALVRASARVRGRARLSSD